MESDNPEFEVVPSVSLGPFMIGMPLPAAISIIKLNHQIYRKVEFQYDDQAPCDKENVVILKDLNIKLSFEPILQYLSKITVQYPTKANVYYKEKGRGKTPIKGDSDLGADEFEHILHLFGPSAGSHDKRKNIYQLKYPGLSFSFPVPKEAKFVNGDIDLTRATEKGFKVQMMDMCITGNPRSQPLKSSFYGEVVEVEDDRSLNFTKRQSKVWLGMHTQDVVNVLGPPCDVFHKSEDKMKIHSNNLNQSEKLVPDYFFNYFDLGVDILFDGTSHEASKFILHSNHPGHFDFDRYFRCNFKINLARKRTSKDLSMQSSVITQQPGPSKRATSEDMDMIDLESDKDDDDFQDARPTLPRKAAPPRKGKSRDNMMIKPTTHWLRVEQFLSTSSPPHVAFNREPTTNATNPYGATRLFYFRHFIFEVMANDSIATVTII
eukprot:m.84350 g.84350  ORF g.84350 m.84350 type:complete len:435 (+) comp12961_c0_seq1:425-1729(+)